MSGSSDGTPQPNLYDPQAHLDLRFWVLILFAGVAAGLGGAGLMMLLRATQHISWAYTSGEFLKAVQRSSELRRVEVLTCAGVIAGGGGVLLKRLFKAGGGEVSEAVWTHHGRVPFFATVARGALSMVIVAMGASLGREGAPQQVAAAAASRLAAWGRLSEPQRRLLVACSAAAGMAAVYDVPLGAALYGIEVLMGELNVYLVLPALAASSIATFVAWIYLPNQPTYFIPSYGFSVSQMAWAICAGPIAGLAAVAYVRAVAWSSRHKPLGWKGVAAPIVVFVALGLSAIPYPQILGNGKDVVQELFVSKDAIVLVIALLILKPLATLSCLGSGAPGGLFTPTLTYGALVGTVLGYGWISIWPGSPLASFAIIGAAAVLAASMQGPISATVLILELTHHAENLMVPILIAVVGAMIVSSKLESRSIYSARAK